MCGARLGAAGAPFQLGFSVLCGAQRYLLGLRFAIDVSSAAVLKGSLGRGGDGLRADARPLRPMCGARLGAAGAPFQLHSSVLCEVQSCFKPDYGRRLFIRSGCPGSPSGARRGRPVFRVVPSPVLGYRLLLAVRV